MAIKDSIRNHFIDDLAQAWKKFSVMAFLLIAAIPDAYSAARDLGLLDLETIPDGFKWTVRAVAILGLYLRLVKQKAKTQATEDAEEANPKPAAADADNS